MANPLLSIVVPLYNAEAYLEQCISSILEQTYENIELILVNDGSTDSSFNICLKYKNIDNRVKLLTQENKGVAVARKNGTQVAKGEYITYVDADDYIDPTLYESVVPGCEGFDLTVFGWVREEKGTSYLRSDPIASGEYTTKHDMDFLLKNLINVSLEGGKVHIKPGFSTFMFNKIFNKEMALNVFNKVDESLAIAEDQSFIYCFFLQCTSVHVLRVYGYHYRIHNQSACHKIDAESSYLMDVTKFYYSLFPIFFAHPQKEILLPQLQLKTQFMLKRALDKMGFSDEAKGKEILFPFWNELKHKKIVLYGAGYIGAVYKYQIEKYNQCEIVKWVDEKWKEYKKIGFNVTSIEECFTENYDYIIIAQTDEKKSKEMIHNLISLGIADKKIIWKSPFIFL